MPERDAGRLCLTYSACSMDEGVGATLGVAGALALAVDSAAGDPAVAAILGRGRGSGGWPACTAGRGGEACGIGNEAAPFTSASSTSGGTIRELGPYPSGAVAIRAGGRPYGGGIPGAAE